MELQYKVLVKEDYIFITFKGRITKESKEALKSCLEQSLTSGASNVVMIMKDINAIDLSMNRDFTLFQHELRHNKKNIYLVGLKLLLKEDLSSRGLVRIHEVKNNLEEVIQIVK